jgi:hypothetical protein
MFNKQRKAMRKIERQMNDAITASKDWRLDNTEVINEGKVSPECYSQCARLQLRWCIPEER